ncbi:hypothetical protein EDC01DRAFT_307373 [Geopyxis carbonaria]|nr:hypothetical protein EDC01DRAFT_307373 [Geopyxis carbonaria]
MRPPKITITALLLLPALASASHPTTPHLKLHSRSTLHLLPRALAPRAADSCTASTSIRCPTTASFCCPSNTECIPLENGTSVICCAADEFCDEIHPIACPPSSASSPDATTATPACGSQCCPSGFSCAPSGDKCLMLTHNLPPKYAEHAAAATGTAASNRKLCEKVLATTCAAFPAKAIVAGFFPGLIAGALALWAYSRAVELRTRRRSIMSFGVEKSGGSRAVSLISLSTGREGGGAGSAAAERESVYAPPSFLQSPQNFSPNLGPTIGPARDRSRSRLREGGSAASVSTRVDSPATGASSGAGSGVGSRGGGGHAMVRGVSEGLFSDTAVETGRRRPEPDLTFSPVHDYIHTHAQTHTPAHTHARGGSAGSDPFRDPTAAAVAERGRAAAASGFGGGAGGGGSGNGGRRYRDELEGIEIEPLALPPRQPMPGRLVETGRGGERGGQVQQQGWGRGV